ncbi:hypothetical protein DEJ32_15070 [Curtobacterium sp. MCPF17_046]|nr:hypothetical protein DEJ32_15070 [Curtobacterium sp. MCPF17_046]
MRAAIEGYVAFVDGGAQDTEYADTYLAVPRVGEDPVGTAPMTIGGTGTELFDAMAQLQDVPFVPQKAQLTAPITFSLGNQAAFSFRLWANADGRDLTIDIIEVMSFDENGKIAHQMAYWGADNVTLL